MDNAQNKILIVDDEEDILEIIRYNLSREGYLIETANNGEIALQKIKFFHPDLIILDIMMPGMDGIELLKKLRKNLSLTNTVILFLTALNNEQTEIDGLDLGADDYLVKPIRPQVLLSRINALLRRSKKESGEEAIDLGDLVIDNASYLVYKGKTEIVLARKEFELLSLLTSSPGRVFTRQEILNRVWGTDVFVGDRTIDVHIRKIRQKVGDYITTVKGVGYRFNH